jgi:opacity protein-like surface antigen
MSSEKMMRSFMNCMKKVIFSICLVGLVFVFPDSGGAGEFKLVPSIAVREEYNDNIFFEDHGEIDDWITTISPGLTLSHRTEQLDLNLSARGDGIKYGQNDELNDIDQNYTGDLSYRITPQMTVSGNAGYTLDSRSDQDIETTGIVLSTERRKRYTGGLGIDYVLSGKSAVSLLYEYERNDYDDPEFEKDKFHNSNLGFTHDLSEFLPRTVGQINFGYSYYDSSDTKIDDYYGTVGLSWEITEVFNLLVGLGSRYTRYEVMVDTVDPLNPFIIQTSKEKDDEWGGVGQVDLSYGGEVTRASLSAQKGISPARGLNGTTDRTSFLFNISRRFAEKFSVSLSGEYFLNKADAGELATEDIDTRTISIRPGLSYEIIDDLVLELSYTYTKVRDREEKSRTRRNLVFVSLSYEYPLFE